MSPPPPQQPPRPQPQQQQPPQPQQQQPQPPPQYQYYPYPHHHPRSKSSSRSFASCILATAFLITLAIAGAITCFILFRPQQPTISVTAMRFPTFTLRNGTANFTFFQYAAVRNPNRFAFSHHGSTVQLLSSSAGPLGFIYIPAGQIAAGHTQFISATFDVKSFPVQPDAAAGGVSAVAESGSVVGPGPTMELETTMALVGSVKVLQVFAHHVQQRAKCRVSIQASDGSLLGYHC